MTNAAKVRLLLLIPIALLCTFIFPFLHRNWADYWLTKDARESTATILQERSHGVVDYKYVVAGKEYRGRGQRNWEVEKYRDVHAGAESIVYFSESRPWLSSLEKPSFPSPGLPPLVVALILETLFVITVINPNSKWALKIRT